ncbi:very short patch repair endonuclease [Micromonospora globbae]|uniref:Very short patch repair endonuclease n=1 Tax=Micromonospora globbae TaxID=1894969 RepID=A0A420F4W6_9ACTN|nr:very short patch repair endonuclease [Micromonospora globbae]RKF27964.1 very short patch repair endonuclease [Micromonospora globbae]
MVCVVTAQDEGPIVVGPPPAASSAGRRRAMQLQRSRDTSPEMALRKALHRRGLRYRVHQRPLAEVRRTVDVVFRPVKVAVEVRGCFWHACPEHGARPRSNAEWWEAKLSRTQQRDRETASRLDMAGWKLVVVWEHESAEAAADLIASLVRQRRVGMLGQRSAEK